MSAFCGRDAMALLVSFIVGVANSDSASNITSTVGWANPWPRMCSWRSPVVVGSVNVGSGCDGRLVIVKVLSRYSSNMCGKCCQAFVLLWDGIRVVSGGMCTCTILSALPVLPDYFRFRRIAACAILG